MAKSQDKQHLFFGRDESWLSFNRRVLEEAQDDTNPLLERVKFLAITASNLDEFVEIRVASILQRIEDGYTESSPDGMTPEQSLAAITENIHDFVAEQGRCWNQQLQPALRKAGVRVLGWDEMDEAARKAAKDFYQREADPLLTPITIDPRHPFPRVLNKALCIALLLRSKRKSAAGPVMGVVTVPRALPRLVPLPSASGTHDFIFLHDLIERNAAGMYRGYEILSKAAFRVTRNSNLYFQEEESRNLLETVRSELHNRRKGDAVRLEIEQDASPEIVDRLRINFELDESQVYRTDGPVNLTRVMNLYSDTSRPDLKYHAFVPHELRLNRKSEDLFDELRHRDILLHHPYDSYDGVVGFIQAAAKDPAVVSIKQTLYRTSSDSPIFQALTEAAQSKEVTVVVELTARFDEASNIRWARDLEDAGVQVFHGIVGLKTHCKLALLVRRDHDGVVRRYGHLGTGNYNPQTARFYTDLSMLTSDAAITASMGAVFNYLTAHSESDDYTPLLMAPLTLAQGFITLIHREMEHAAAGRPARIIAKMNSLLEPSVIQALYDASKAGVQIDLIVRGICSLRPGVPGLSENIRMISIIGRFLEHSRIFYFENGGKEEFYCGSADWMPRNLFERCEVVFPIRDAQICGRIRNEILAAYLADTVKARWLDGEGVYHRVRDTKKDLPVFSSQDFFMQVAENKASIDDIPKIDAGHANHHKHAEKPVKKAAAKQKSAAD
ncbi:polyphosphate kinase [Silvibacterium bohemicum]|uniref:Polyphosphate kinase n=1 Tax=Silvibacterium bohemicum TaxID=1577686 RepID=A0A841JXP9_9BACT|nr:polyphosphate kinase 1 [Silvibacterium bohemicum]MBB6146122.1 polyphosphate kinase [Silvibacterium bohemicum]